MGISVLHRSKVDLHKCGPHGYADNQFVVTFVTTAPNTEANIFMAGCSADNVMDWGDGQTETFNTNNPVDSYRRPHIYEKPGTYTAVYTGTVLNVGSLNQTIERMAPLVSIDHWGEKCGTVNVENLFAFVSLTRTVQPPKSVTSYYRLFRDIVKIIDDDLSHWDTSHVTNMYGMFHGAKTFNGNISTWNTSNVTDMGAMFLGAKVFNGDIGRWDTSAVTDMKSMFESASKFNCNIADWVVSQVASMDAMFLSASAFLTDLSTWRVPLIASAPSYFGIPVARQPQWGVA